MNLRNFPETFRGTKYFRIFIFTFLYDLITSFDLKSLKLVRWLFFKVVLIIVDTTQILKRLFQTWLDALTELMYFNSYLFDLLRKLFNTLFLNYRATLTQNTFFQIFFYVTGYRINFGQKRDRLIQFL